MPSYTRGKKRFVLTFVQATTNLMYGFKTKDLTAIAGVSEADLTALGHMDDVAAAAVANTVRILGANTPKPPRVTRRLENATNLTQGTVSTFCAYTALAAAQAAGFTMTTPLKSVTLQAPSDLRKSCTAIAELSNGTLYAFPMNRVDFEAYSAALGLMQASEISGTERPFLLTGSTSTKPGKAQLLLGDGSTIQSFYATANADTLSGAGWSIISGERVFDAALAP